MDKTKKQQRQEEREEKIRRKIPLNKYTLGGRKSSLVALVNCIVIFIMIIISILTGGNVTVYGGLVLALVTISAFYGFFVGARSFMEERTKFLRFSYIGTIVNAIIWICMILVYITYV